MPSSSLLGHLYSHGMNKHTLMNEHLKENLKRLCQGQADKENITSYFMYMQAEQPETLENLVALALFQVNYVGNVFMLYARCKVLTL